MAQIDENKANNPDNYDPDWLMLVYTQAWAQYTHEDEMAEQRDSKYLTIISLFLSAIGVVCSMLFTYLTNENKDNVLAVCMVAVVAVLLIMIILFACNWLHVTQATEDFVKARIESLKKIEIEIHDPIQLASKEIKSSKKDGFATTKNLVWIILIVSAILLAAAIAGIFLLLYI